MHFTERRILKKNVKEIVHCVFFSYLASFSLPFEITNTIVMLSILRKKFPAKMLPLALTAWFD